MRLACAPRLLVIIYSDNSINEVHVLEAFIPSHVGGKGTTVLIYLERPEGRGVLNVGIPGLFSLRCILVCRVYSSTYRQAFFAIVASSFVAELNLHTIDVNVCICLWFCKRATESNKLNRTHSPVFHFLKLGSCGDSLFKYVCVRPCGRYIALPLFSGGASRNAFDILYLYF